MKIAFISANREHLPDTVPPLGLLYVMGSVSDSHVTELWDLCFADDPLQMTREQINRFQPDVIALGLRNIQNNDYSDQAGNLAYYRDLVATVRRSSNATLVVGGSGFSVMPEQLMARLRPDFGIAGEGEAAFAQLVNVVVSGPPDFTTVPGLYHFVGGALVHNPRLETFPDIDPLPFPQRSLLDPAHLLGHGIDSVQTKRGCPLRCTYCTYPLIEGRIVRQRDPRRVVDELLDAQQQRPEIRHFFVVDAVFNVPPEHAKAVCREMIGRGFSTPWTCYITPLGFDPELAGLLKRAGCAGVEVGTDSGSARVLDLLQKGFTPEQAIALHQRCRAVDLPDCHTFVLGTPGEHLEDVQQTLDFCVALDPFAAILMIWTDDHDTVDGAAQAKRAQFRDHVRERMLREAPRFARWIVPELEINFDPALFAALRRLGFRGPMWQHIQDAPAASGHRRRRSRDKARL